MPVDDEPKTQKYKGRSCYVPPTYTERPMNGIIHKTPYATTYA